MKSIKLTHFCFKNFYLQIHWLWWKVTHLIWEGKSCNRAALNVEIVCLLTNLFRRYHFSMNFFFLLFWTFVFGYFIINHQWGIQRHRLNQNLTRVFGLFFFVGSKQRPVTYLTTAKPHPLSTQLNECRIAKSSIWSPIIIIIITTTTSTKRATNKINRYCDQRA